MPNKESLISFEEFSERFGDKKGKRMKQLNTRTYLDMKMSTSKPSRKESFLGNPVDLQKEGKERQQC